MRLRSLLTAVCLAAVTPAWAQEAGPDAAGGRGFVAAHGQRSAVMGYPETGLEVWAYPLQILSGWKVAFREAGRVQPLDGAALLTRTERHGAEIVRVYNGPDFVVRERLFAPIDQPGAILTYEVEGKPDVEIEVRFQPSLDLMWPGALGGQSIQWDAAKSAYVEREPLHGFSAEIRSPDAVDHDGVMNRARPMGEGVAMVLKPHAAPGGARIAGVYIGSDAPHAQGAASVAQVLEDREGELRRAADAHAAAVSKDALQIVTPDAAVNRALAGAIDALDQAWVCDPGLGCGEVAGYGPSRPGRRPQYDWFFAGDGLVAVEALEATGQYARAREELEFIVARQNKANGMIWHEISQSAPYLDWENKYPYMFVHVDITYQYLTTLAGYVATTGDRDFLKAHWAGIAAAYHYCRSLVDPQLHVPQIPRGKEGENEQDVMRDDLGLTSAWIDAADAYASLARAAGHAGEAADAEAAAKAARKAIADQDWDAAHNFWLSGHTADGRPIYDQRAKGVRVLQQGVFAPAQIDAVLDRLSGPDFQTDWGERSLSSAASDFDPNAYSHGSVWALGTAGVANAFFADHRPLVGFSLLRGLGDWAELDSPARMHEVLAGDLFHPEAESVPEQTWSSSGYLTSTIHGLLGIEARGAERRLTLAPHLPAGWDHVELNNLRVGASRLNLRIAQDGQGVRLEVDNAGEPVAIDFAPEVPLGAELKGADVNGAKAEAVLEPHAQDAHARLKLEAGSGRTVVVIRYAGGVRITAPVAQPRIGDASRGLKIAEAGYADHVLKVRAFVKDADHADLDFRTPLKPVGAEGASLQSLGGDAWRLQVPVAPGQAAYAPVAAVVRFAAEGG